jgi:hypothetical protein
VQVTTVALLDLATMVSATRARLLTITPILMAAAVVQGSTGIFPLALSLPLKVARKMCHQAQINKTN